MHLLVSLLILLLYVVIAILIVEIILFVLGLIFTPLPGRLRQLLYAIVGIIFLIWLVQLLLGNTQPLHLP